jgi:hypothetical protein
VFENIQGAPAKLRRSPLGQRVLMLLAFVHDDITGTDGLASFIARAFEAIVVDHCLNFVDGKIGVDWRISCLKFQRTDG